MIVSCANDLTILSCKSLFVLCPSTYKNNIKHIVAFPNPIPTQLREIKYLRIKNIKQLKKKKKKKGE
jgi:hypothetical protein